MLRPLIAALGIALPLSLVAHAQTPIVSDWGHHGGDALAQRYSPLAEINRDNVSDLEVAWTFRAGELLGQVAPILAFGRLYFATPGGSVIALTPDAGTEIWRHAASPARSAPTSGKREERHHVIGLAAWQDPLPAASGVCVRRLFFLAPDRALLALDAESGQPCSDFGAVGVVPLDRAASAASPPLVHIDAVIVSDRSGVRAFDARTGAARWTHSRPATGPMSLDDARGIVYVPAFGNTLVALDAAAGTLLWQRELIHRDLWGYELEAQPALVDLEIEGRSIAAVVQGTHTARLFVFDREHGTPLRGVSERAVPGSLVPGLTASPTQPFPDTPALADIEAIVPDDAWGLTFWDRGKCRARIARHRNEGLFTPPGTRGTIVRPSRSSGIGPAGVAIDGARRRIIATVTHASELVTLIPPGEIEARRESADPSRAEFSRLDGTPYGVQREPLVSPWDLPCVRPPWGTLVNVDLEANRIVWEIPLGSSAASLPAALPTRDFGLPGVGAPIVTAGELVFVAASSDNEFRAFDLETGAELWKHELPAGGQATPMTYRAGESDAQYVVIVAGGNDGLQTRRGDYVVAFQLPRK